MSAVAAKRVDTPRKGVSKEEVVALVNSDDGTRVNMDIAAQTIEIVEITGFDSATSTVKGCKHVRECRAHEEHLLMAALSAGMIRRHPCDSPCGTVYIAVMS